MYGLSSQSKNASAAFGHRGFSATEYRTSGCSSPASSMKTLSPALGLSIIDARTKADSSFLIESMTAAGAAGFSATLMRTFTSALWASLVRTDAGVPGLVARQKRDVTLLARPESPAKSCWNCGASMSLSSKSCCRSPIYDPDICRSGHFWTCDMANSPKSFKAIEKTDLIYLIFSWDL